MVNGSLYALWFVLLFVYESGEECSNRLTVRNKPRSLHISEEAAVKKEARREKHLQNADESKENSFSIISCMRA